MTQPSLKNRSDQIQLSQKAKTQIKESDEMTSNQSVESLDSSINDSQVIKENKAAGSSSVLD